MSESGILTKRTPSPFEGRLVLEFWKGYSASGRARKLCDPHVTVREGDIVEVGWLEGAQSRISQKPIVPENEETITVTSFGQSFANHVIELLPSIDPRFKTQIFAAPGAPPNWCYAAYKRFGAQHPSKVRVIGVLENSLMGVRCLTAMTLYRDSGVYTFPKFEIQNGQWVETKPQIQSFEQFRAAAQVPERWDRFAEQLAKEDALFCPWAFHHDFFDHSLILRRIKNIFIEHHREAVLGKLYVKNILDENSEPVVILRSLLKQFAADCRAEGAVPAVLLFSKKGSGSGLKNALKGILDSSGVVFVAASDIFDVNDPAYFEEDGHYRPDINRKMAQALAGRLLAAK